MIRKRFFLPLMVLMLCLVACQGADTLTRETGQLTTQSTGIPEENKFYYKKEDVAAYIVEYGKLPPNYITKKEAMEAGWDSQKGNLWDVTNKKVIGGDIFRNYEKALPEKKGRIYYECDVNYNGGYRGEERLVFSNDGLIYYTSDHYQTFESIRGEGE